MFNIVVTCVGSKKIEGPSIKNVINNLLKNRIKDDVEKLFNEWKRILLQHLKSSTSLMKARSLYKGSMWNASVEAFNSVIKPRQLWVISCGFGFINSKEKISGYHCTFKRGEFDSLYDRRFFQTYKSLQVKRQWWNLLTEIGILETYYPRAIHELVNNSKSDDVVLIAAGKDYYEAIFDDLIKINISEKLPKLALVGIKRKHEGYEPSIPKRLEPYIQSFSDGKKLSEFLNCNKIQIHPKCALFLIRQYNKTGKLEYKFP